MKVGMAYTYRGNERIAGMGMNTVPLNYNFILLA